MRQKAEAESSSGTVREELDGLRREKTCFNQGITDTGAAVKKVGGCQIRQGIRSRHGIRCENRITRLYEPTRGANSGAAGFAGEANRTQFLPAVFAA